MCCGLTCYLCFSAIAAPLLQNHVHYPGSCPQTSLLQKELALGCLKSGHLVCVSAEPWASGEEPGTMLRVKAHDHAEPGRRPQVEALEPRPPAGRHQPMAGTCHSPTHLGWSRNPASSSPNMPFGSRTVLSCIVCGTADTAEALKTGHALSFVREPHADKEPYPL